jgi:Kef-type K+ transport system membrane component KefB
LAAVEEEHTGKQQMRRTQGRVPTFALRFALLVLGLLAVSPAWAAGAAIPSLVQDIGVSLLAAGLLGVIFTRLKIPAIAAFLLAGVVVGPLGLKQVTDPANVDTIAQLGFILLLFLIGLEIDLKKILASGKPIILSGLLQFPLTVLFAVGVVKLIVYFGIGGSLSVGSPLGALYIGVIVACSSTLLVVKLFQENFELDTVPGRLSLGILIFQDIWVIIAILIQPNLQHPDLGLIAMSFLGIVLLGLFTVIVALSIVGRAFRWIAKTPEMTLLGALAWCFIVVFVGVNLDTIFEATYGRSYHMAVGPGMAALIAGASIANLPSSTEIITKVATVKDFFITLFFVALGISIPMPEGLDVLVIAVWIAVLAVVARQLVFFPLFYFTGVDQRNAQVSAVRLAQISEFGLVLAFLGLQLGHISPSMASAVIFAFIITALATPLMYVRAYQFHKWLQPLLEKIGFRAPPEHKLEKGRAYKLALLGFHRDASSLLYNLVQSDPDLVKETLVVDFNVALHAGIAATGATVKYGDLANPETLHHLGLNRCSVILSTIHDDVLRGIDNRSLVHVVREMAPQSVIIANAIVIDEVHKVYQAGADYVYLNRFEVAWTLQRAIQAGINGQIDVFRTERQSRNHYKPDRKEILS